MAKSVKKKHRSERQRVVNSQKAVKRVLLLSAAYLMEEQDWDDDRLCQYYEDIIRWSDAIDSHLLTIEKVIEIVNEKTGSVIHW